MVFAPNDSPLAGKTGVNLTGTKIGERLTQEADTSVSLKVRSADSSGESYEVQARGELQLGLLIGRSSCSKRAAGAARLWLGALGFDTYKTHEN